MLEWAGMLLAALLGGGLVSAVAQVITAKSHARASDIENIRKHVDELQEDNTHLRAELRAVEAHYKQKCDEYEARVVVLSAELRRLQKLMRACGIDPDGDTPTQTLKVQL